MLDFNYFNSTKVQLEPDAILDKIEYEYFNCTKVQLELSTKKGSPRTTVISIPLRYN